MSSLLFIQSWAIIDQNSGEHDQAVNGRAGREIILWLCFVTIRDHGDEEPVTSHWPVTSGNCPGADIGWHLEQGHDDTMTAQYSGQHHQPSIIFRSSQSSLTCHYWPWYTVILTWGVYSLSFCVTSQGGERSMTVYCHSLGSAPAQSPAWGQLGARVRSGESLDQSGPSIEVTRHVLTNQRTVLRVESNNSLESREWRVERETLYL